MTDAHQDVGGVVERLRHRMIGHDICQEAATLIESLSKALSEAEAEAAHTLSVLAERTSESDVFYSKLQSAESRLAEAMKVIEPFAACVFNDNGDMSVTASRAKYDDFVGAYLVFRATRRFLNAGKE
jgi:hypothetical protein